MLLEYLQHLHPAMPRNEIRLEDYDVAGAGHIPGSSFRPLLSLSVNDSTVLLSCFIPTPIGGRLSDCGSTYVTVEKERNVRLSTSATAIDLFHLGLFFLFLYCFTAHFYCHFFGGAS